MLSHYYSLIGWAEGLASAGAQVTVYQRYRRGIYLQKRGIPYHFIAEYGDNLQPWQIPWHLNRQVQVLCRQNVLADVPTIVHMNGFVFPLPTQALRFLLPRSVPLIVQHHGARPARGWKRWVQGATLRNLDGYFFAARDLAQEWIEAGIIHSMDDVHEIMETSTLFSYQDRQGARKVSGMFGNPILFWAGNLDSNKDPLTILNGFERLLASYPAAHLYMAFRRHSLLAKVTARIDSDALLSRSVTLLGRLSRSLISYYFNSADLFVQGSGREGSGIALLDAMACGAIPVVTNIPPFRTMLDNGRVGALWPVGDENGFLAALQQVLTRPMQPQSQAVIDLFKEKWSFAAIGRKTLQVYTHIWRQRQEWAHHN